MSKPKTNKRWLHHKDHVVSPDDSDSVVVAMEFRPENRYAFPDYRVVVCRMQPRVTTAVIPALDADGNPERDEDGAELVIEETRTEWVPVHTGRFATDAIRVRAFDVMALYNAVAVVKQAEAEAIEAFEERRERERGRHDGRPQPLVHRLDVPTKLVLPESGPPVLEEVEEVEEEPRPLAPFLRAALGLFQK